MVRVPINAKIWGVTLRGHLLEGVGYLSPDAF